MLGLAVGCGRSVRHVASDGTPSANAGASNSPGDTPDASPDDPVGFGAAPVDICDCSSSDQAACCTTLAPGPFAACPGACGNGVTDTCVTPTGTLTEACEPDQLDGSSCASLGFVSGTLACSDTCYFDFSRCEECVQEGPVTACAHPLDEHNDAGLPALAANGDSLALAFTTGTSTENGYDGDTSVRLALFDSTLAVTRTVAFPMRYASALSLAPDSDGWLLLVETLNYVGFDGPPDGVLQRLLSFDADGTPRGAVTFHDRSGGSLIARDSGGPPLYVYTKQVDSTPTVFGQVLSYDARKSVGPFIVDTGGATEAVVAGCGAGIAGGYEIAVRHPVTGFHLVELSNAGVQDDAVDLAAPEPGACAYSLTQTGPQLIYQSRDSDQFGPSMHWVDLRALEPTVIEFVGPVEGYRALGTGAGSVALCGHAPPLSAADLLLVWLDASGDLTTTTPIVRGAAVPAYDMVQFGGDAVVAWVAQSQSGTPLGRLGMARVALGAGAMP
jgi:hypothetical protein